MKKYQDKVYEVGDYVMLYTPTCETGLRPKLTTMWRGPYQVVRKLSPVTYTVKHLLFAGKPMQTVHAHRLKRYCPRNDGDAQVAEHERAQALGLEISDRPGEILGIPVEKIVDKRVHNKAKQYRVRWKGCQARQDTWEPEAAVSNVPELVEQFEAQRAASGQVGYIASTTGGRNSPAFGRGVLATDLTDANTRPHRTARPVDTHENETPTPRDPGHAAPTDPESDLGDVRPEHPEDPGYESEEVRTKDPLGINDNPNPPSAS
jgi:hypothetical protein